MARYHVFPRNSIDELGGGLALSNMMKMRIITLLFPTPVGPITLEDFVGTRLLSGLKTLYSQNDDVTFPGIFDFHDTSTIFEHLSDKASF